MFESLNPPERLTLQKEIIREASLIARDESFIVDADSITNKSSILTTISRVVWDCDTRRANTLLSRCPYARSLLIVRDNVPTLIDKVSFDDLI